MTDIKALAWEVENHAVRAPTTDELALDLAIERARSRARQRAHIAMLEATLSALTRPVEIYHDNEGDVLLHQLAAANPRKEAAS